MQTCRRLEKWQPPLKFRLLKTHRIYLFIYLLNRFSSSFQLHQSKCFWPLICFLIHWMSNVNMSTRIRTQYFYSCFVNIWKVVHIQLWKFGTAQLGLLSNNFCFQNITCQYFPSSGWSTNENLWEIVAARLHSSAHSGVAAHSSAFSRGSRCSPKQES